VGRAAASSIASAVCEEITAASPLLDIPSSLLSSPAPAGRALAGGEGGGEGEARAGGRRRSPGWRMRSTTWR
jgi:hypothetical protein